MMLYLVTETVSFNSQVWRKNFQKLNIMNHLIKIYYVFYDTSKEYKTYKNSHNFWQTKTKLCVSDQAEM